jgi:hypothetical protein
LLQKLSTSSWFLQLTWNEIASLNVNWGPPFNARNGCPSSSKLTVMTVPAGRGPASPYRDTSLMFEFGKTDV